MADYSGLIKDTESRLGIREGLLGALITKGERSGVDAVSPKGAAGLAQLMPGTAADLGVKDRLDPAQSIDGGGRYLKQMLDKFGGDETKAVAAYNAGPGAVQKYGGVPPYKETQRYVKRVLGGNAPMASATPSVNDLQAFFGGGKTQAAPARRQTSTATSGPPSAADLQAYYGSPQEPPQKAKITRAANPAFGAITTLNRSIPLVDELADAGASALNYAQGKDPSLGAAWQRQRAMTGANVEGYGNNNPLASNFIKGVGTMAQAVPAFFSGGATAVPTVAANSGRIGLIGGAKALLGNTAKAATVGAATGAVSGAAGEGNIDQRLKDAKVGAVVGGVTGAAIPVGGAISGKALRAAAPVVRTVVRATNRATGGKLLDPTKTATSRLVEALHKDGASPDQIRQIAGEWERVGGPSPTLIDIVSQLPSGGQSTLGLVRGAAVKAGPARGKAVTYAKQVGADLQDNAIARTRDLTPDQRSIPMIQGQADATIAANSNAPQVTPGRAGAQVSARLNSEFDQGKGGVDAAYSAVRNSDAEITAPTITELPGRLRSALDDHLITPEVMGSLNPATRAILGEIDKLSGQAGRLESAAAPNVAASLDAGIPSGGTGAPPTFPIAQIERIRKAINARLPTAQGEDQVALQITKREFDGWLNDAMDKNLIVGDPQAISLLNTARSLHAKQRTKFGGEDLLQTLTERDRHGAGRANVVSPDDASNAILGRGTNISNRQDMTRDLTRLRDTLGADSPEWRQLQQEGRARLLGRDAGTENYGAAWGRFSQENPDLAALLSTPADDAALAASRQQIGGAVADRQALGAGQGILNTVPDQYAAGVRADIPRLPLAQVGAARSIEDAIGRPTEGATGILNRLSTSTNQGRNLATTYGDETAGDYRQSVSNMVDQLNNARFINPNTGSQTIGRAGDEALVEMPPLTKTGILMTIVRKLQQGATLTDAERLALVEMGTTPTTLDSAIPQAMPRLRGQIPRLAGTVAAGAGADASGRSSAAR